MGSAENAEAKPQSRSAFQALLSPGQSKHALIFGVVIASLCVLLSLFHIFTASIGSTESYQTRTFVVSVAMLLGFLIYPTGRERWDSPLNAWFVVDLIILFFVLATQIYVWYQMAATNGLLISGMIDFQMWQIIVGVIYVGLLMELTRRCAGWPMLSIALLFIIYVLFAEYAPSAIQAPNTSVTTLTRNLFYNLNGIFGVPVGAMTDYVIIFILFGQMFAAAGAGDFFTDISMALTGRQIGGPAKAAVISSSLMGTISGSAVGNVVTTGSVTIPLMSRTGFKPSFAAAVESVASTGGQIAPPVMGAVAFIMAQLAGVPYVQIAAAAVVPAVLYYWAAFLAVHWEARRLGIGTLPSELLPRAGKVMMQGWYYLLPVVLLITLLANDSSLIQAAALSTALSFAISFVRRDTRITPARLLHVFESTGRTSLVILVVAAAAGVIISVVTTSGLSWRALSLLVDFAGDQLWLALILSAVIALILGMGVSTTAVYITLAAILVPALNKMGLEPIAAHMFALYYAVIGLITPPVAMAAFAAAGISRSKPMKVALLSARIALPIYLVPFIFAYHPALLLIGSWESIAIQVSISFVGVFIFSSALWGQMLMPLAYVERAVLFVAGVLLLSPWNPGAVIGLAIFVVSVLIQLLRRNRDGGPLSEGRQGGNA